MEVRFYTNKSELNKIDKELELITTKNGTLKDDASITNPVILFESSTPISANYAYIPEFGRYYFIKDVVCEGRMFWRVHMHVDVLSTYAEQIRQCSAVVSRQQFDYNMYLPDGKYPKAQNTFTITNALSSSFGTNTRNVLLLANSKGETV